MSVSSLVYPMAGMFLLTVVVLVRLFRGDGSSPSP